MNLQALAESLGLDPPTVERLVGTFVASTERDARELERAVAAGDLEGVARLAHHIKGAAAALEIESIAQEARALERQAKEGTLEGAPGRVASLLGHLKSLSLDLQ